MAFYSLSYLELMSPENRKWKVHKGWLGGFVVVIGTQHPRAATTLYTKSSQFLAVIQLPSIFFF